MAAPLSDVEFFSLALRTLGARRAVIAIGWCVFWWLNGIRSFADVDLWVGDQRRKGGPSRAVVYHVLSDLKKLRQAWADAEGRTLDEIGPLERTAERIAGLRTNEAA